MSSNSNWPPDWSNKRSNNWHNNCGPIWSNNWNNYWSWSNNWSNNWNPNWTSIKEILETNKTDLLADAFLWDSTPQGFKYWRNIARYEKELPHEALMFLTAMLNEYENDKS